MTVHQLSNALDRRIDVLMADLKVHAFFYKPLGEPFHDTWQTRQNELKDQLRKLLDQWYSLRSKPSLNS